MKKNLVLLVAFSCIAAANLQAQISKGTILLGGQLTINSMNTDPSSVNANYQKGNAFSITPMIGKAVKDNLVVGIELSYGLNQSRYALQTDAFYANNKENSYGFGVFIRKYAPLGKRFYLFGQSSVDGAYSTENNQSGMNSNFTQDVKGYSVSAGIYPGISYQVSKKLQIETSLVNLFTISYAHSSNSQFADGVYSKTITNYFNANTSLNQLSFTVGFKFLL